MAFLQAKTPQENTTSSSSRLFGRPLPQDIESYDTPEILVVKGFDQTQKFIDLAKQRALSHIGLFVMSIGDGDSSATPKSIKPAYLSVALVEPTGNNHIKIYDAVIDLSDCGVIEPLRELITMETCFVAHGFKEILFSLWNLGLPEPFTLWDSQICEEANSLGKIDCQSKGYGLGMAEKVRVQEAMRKKEKFCTLNSTCNRYGITTKIMLEEDLQLSLGLVDPSIEIPQHLGRKHAEKARLTARLYPYQVNDSLLKGTLQHLITVEMPWVITNARIEWHGVRVDLSQGPAILRLCQKQLADTDTKIATYGIIDPEDQGQRHSSFKTLGIHEHFLRYGHFVADANQLKDHRNLHPLVNMLYLRNKLIAMLNQPLLSGVFESGRIYPEHIQLGAVSGRQTCANPNISGIGRVLRPLVRPEDGFGIGEVDLAQIEVGIAAVIFNDQNLIDLFNKGDVYAATARDFYRNELPPDAHNLSIDEFKSAFPDYRDSIKTCLLGTFYGITAQGVASKLVISRVRAQALMNSIYAMFPSLKGSIDISAAFIAMKGHAGTCSGLRRYRAHGGPLVGSERNSFINFLIQGSAAVVFKAAGNRLDKLYQKHNARLIIPLHDSFVFEAPLDQLDEVAQLTARIMCETVRSIFRPLINVP